MRNSFYFILSSEIMENISAIKVVSVYSEIIWYHFTVDWYYHFHAGTTFFDNFGHSCFPKRFCMHHSRLTLHYGRIHFISSNWRHTLTSLYSSRNANLHATLVQQQLQAAFLNCKILLIPSFKWHFKPFSRCKLCLHPILDPINALSQAELTRND